MGRVGHALSEFDSQQFIPGANGKAPATQPPHSESQIPHAVAFLMERVGHALSEFDSHRLKTNDFPGLKTGEIVLWS